MSASYKTLTIALMLILTSCTNSSAEQISSASSSASSQSSSEEVEPMRLSDDCMGQNGPVGDGPWMQVFEKAFPAIFSSKDFKELWSVETECVMDGTNTLLTYVYLANKHEYLHTVIAVFNPEKKLLRHVDIACPFYDDIGGAVLMAESKNSVLVRCHTRGTQGVHTQYYSLNLDSFSKQLVVEKKCTYHVDGRFEDPNVPEKLVGTAFGEIDC